jgi:C_GCAxxG_C_C family probable redox protein
VSRTDGALSLFDSGFNCAQSVLGAFGPGLGLERETALKMGATFGGGVAHTGRMCGVVTGALMVIGLKRGSAKPRGGLRRMLLVRASKKFMERFGRDHGSIYCNELRGYKVGGRYVKGKNDLCLEFIRDVCGMLEGMV